ncbi:MAG: GGDEF domain-containing protein [Acidobacteria bacterium]|nr:MAG: GGDEF domain-containing protein [Acidobacteriota bacterium]
MSGKRPATISTATAETAAPAARRPAPAGRGAVPSGAELTARLAVHLDPADLQRALLEVMLARGPHGARALTSLDPESGTPEFVGEDGSIRPFERDEPVPPLLAASLVAGDTAHGWIAWELDEAVAARRASLEAVLAQLAADAAVPAANARRYRAALELGMTDPLTGLHNRRMLESLLEREAERARRHGHELALALCDLDAFKEINDTLGHAAGDIALQGAARRMLSVLRRTDLLVRYGGDEFVALLPGASAAQARCLQPRLGQRLSAEPVEIPGTPVALRLSVSVGVADLAAADGDPWRMLLLADQDLYRAKRARSAARRAVRRAARRASRRLASEGLDR